MKLPRKLTLLCALFALSISAFAQTAVSGSKVQDGTGAGGLLVSGQWCFGATCLTVTNGAFSGSVTSGTQTVTVKNASAATILTVPSVVVGSSPFNWDLFVTPSTASISGTGSPLIACSVGATYTQTDASAPNNVWTCGNFAGLAQWLLTSSSGASPSGAYSGFGPPSFSCVSPCSYTDISLSPTYSTTSQSGTTSRSWQRSVPSFVDSVARSAASAAQATANAALPMAGGTLTGALGLTVTNPVQVPQFTAPTFSPQWQFQIFNARHTWTRSSGWYADSYIPHSYNFEDDQPGIDLAAPSYGSGGHSEFYPYYYEVISRSPAFLEYGTSWQQNSISDSGQYDTGWCQGGWINGDDEGCFHLNYNGGELSSAYTGTVTSTGTNSVMTSCTGGCPTYNSGSGTYSGGDQGDLRYLIITSSPMASGHIESTTKPSGQIPGTLTVDTTVPVSTAWGTLQANCGPANVASPVGVTTTASSCSVNLNSITAFGNSPGAFTTSSIVCFAGQFHECAYPTSVGTPSGGVQSVSFNLLYPHNSGSVIMQGGAADTYIDLLVNRGTDNTSGTGTLKYPIDVIGSTSASTLVDVEFWIANGGTTYSINDGNLTGNLLLGSGQGVVSNASNSGGVVTMTLNGTQVFPPMQGQNVYLYNAADSTFDGACTNFKMIYALYPTSVTATCSQSSSAGHTSATLSIALNCTASNASCSANQYGNGDFVLYKGAQVLDVQDPSSSPANAIDGYFLLEPNPWTWTGATVEEPHHYASQVAERKGTLEVANPTSETGGVSIRFQGTGLGTPFTDSTFGAVNGHYNASSLFTGQNVNSPSLYSYFGGTMVAPNGMSFQGLLYDDWATEFAPEWGGSVLWVGAPESSGGFGGSSDPGYYYNLFFLSGNTGNNYASYFPYSNELVWFGPQEFIAQNHVAFNVKDTGLGGTNVGIIFGGLSGTSTQAVPVERDATLGTNGDVTQYSNCSSGTGCGVIDSGIAASAICQSNGTHCPSSSGGSTQWGFNAVSDVGLSTSGTASANASALSTFLNSALAQAGPLMIPCGTYALNPVTVSATNSTKGLITVIGANKTSWIGGSSCVTFNCTALSADCLWYDNSSTNAGNQLGIRLEHLNFTDGSGGVGAHSGLRITQYNNVQLTDISAQNFLGTHVTSGTCSVTNGSTAVTGSGTSWPTAATDGHLWVGGTGPTVGGVATADFQEIASVNSATSITLRNAWQGSTASGASCSFDYNGNGFEFDGGSGFAQYWDLRGLGGYNNRVWMFTPGGASSIQGVSRFNIYSGFNNCHGNSGSNPNTIAMTFGNYSDVHRIDNDVNNCAVGIDDEGAHALVIGSFHNENVSTSEPIVNVCNGGVQSEACSIGINFASGFMVSDFTSLGTYLIKTGIAFKFNGNPINLEKAKIMGSLFQDYGPSGTENDLNYWFGDGTTCQTQSIVTVVNDDCTNLQGPSLTVNGLQWLNGSGAPSGSCTTGSFYSNTSGGTGTTLYACVSSAWVDVK